MQHPDLTMMIHESMQREERRRAAFPRLHDQLGPFSTVRALAGNALIALGSRIAPAPRPRPLTGRMADLPLAVTSRNS